MTWFIEALLLLGLWLLFAGPQPHEWIVGAAAAALAATAIEAVRSSEHPRFFPPFHQLLRAWRLPFEILRDCGLLLRNLVRGGDGRFVRVPFEAGGDDARGIAHRALQTLFSTLPPNAIVIGIDRDRNELLLHVLEGEL